ncbi:hypothetical protein JW905_13575, partial [bacterium]|nr:hypothetical protein [candidate division CSSED10-310 bacterium]
MLILYNLMLLAAAAAIIPVLLWRIAVKGKYRKGLGERLGFVKFNDKERDAHWLMIHAVSVGEVAVAAPLIEMLKQRAPELHILLTTTTDTGQAVAQTAGADRVTYFPCDLPGSATRLMRAIRIHACLIVETEIWPNFLFAAKRVGAKVAIVNGRISDTSFHRYKCLGGMAARILNLFDLCCMQSGTDAERLLALGASGHRVAVTGNVKFDRAAGMGNGNDTLSRADYNLPEGRPILLAGSIHGQEADYILEAFQ